MGLIFGLIKRLIKFAFYLLVLIVLSIAIVTLIPNLPPYTKFTTIEIDPTLPRVGPLEPNGALNNAGKLFVRKELLGPEAFQLYNGEVYTSLATGEIVKLSMPGEHVTFVTKIGQPCVDLTQEHICGRPLGFVIDEKNGNMYVADAYYGIWKVDLKTDKKQLLVSPWAEIDGRTPKLFNSVALAKNGDLYWTDSSSDFPLKKGIKTTLADPSGRLFHYNPATNRSKVVVDDIWFANGVVVSPDSKFVVVAETYRLRLLKYYIDGPKKGESEVFLTGIPGTPDNLGALPDGSGFLVGLYSVLDEDTPFLAKSLSKTPVIRKYLARMLTLAETLIEFVNSLFPNHSFETIAYNIGTFKMASGLLPKGSGLLQVDWNGNIIASYFNTDGSLKHISDAIVYQGNLLTGSPHSQNYIGVIPAPPLLNKAFASKQSTPPPKTAETVTKPVPKPTEAPKPKVEEQKVARKVVKPVAEVPPKPAESKKAEPVKVTIPKPVEKKPTPPPTAAPTTKPPPTKPPTTTPAPKNAETITTTPKPQAQTEEPVKTTSSPKPTTAKPAQTPPPDTKSTETKQKTKKQKAEKVVPETIPIREEIPSDTVKPSKETLKVIKRDGPAEIPNPEL